jgi:dolichol kinase
MDKVHSLPKDAPLLARFPSMTSHTGTLQEITSELLRKGIHFLIALTPTLAALSLPVTMLVLMAGTLLYAWLEALRLSGVHVPVISSVTAMASRSRDKGRFVLGPVTLGLGALLSLLLYPSPAASIAIYALAFGDGFASLIGKLVGRVRPAFLHGKSVEGSTACFLAVFAAAYRVTYDYKLALAAAVSATVAEALPVKDYDNLIIPLIVGATVTLMELTG